MWWKLSVTLNASIYHRSKKKQQQQLDSKHMIKDDKSANDLQNCYLVGSIPTVSIFPFHQLSSAQHSPSFRLSVKPKRKPLNALILWFMTMKNESLRLFVMPLYLNSYEWWNNEQCISHNILPSDKWHKL